MRLTNSMMQAKHRPPSIILLCIIGIVAILALSGAIMLGYMVITGHAP